MVELLDGKQDAIALTSSCQPSTNYRPKKMQRFLLTIFLILAMIGGGGSLAKSQVNAQAKKEENRFHLSINPSVGINSFVNSGEGDGVSFLGGFRAAVGYGIVYGSSGYLLAGRDKFGGNYSVVPIAIGFVIGGNRTDKFFTITKDTYFGIALTNYNITNQGVEQDESNLGFLFGNGLGLNFNISENFVLSVNNDLTYIVRPNRTTITRADNGESATNSVALSNILIYQFGLGLKYRF